MADACFLCAPAGTCMTELVAALCGRPGIAGSPGDFRERRAKGTIGTDALVRGTARPLAFQHWDT